MSSSFFIAASRSFQKIPFQSPPEAGPALLPLGVLPFGVRSGTLHTGNIPSCSSLLTLNTTYGTLENSSLAVTHVYLLEVTDRDALSEHGAALFSESDECVYIIAEQTIDGFAIPYIIETCYLISADGTAKLNVDGLMTLDTYSWQTEYAGIMITDVTTDAQECMTAVAE